MRRWTPFILSLLVHIALMSVIFLQSLQTTKHLRAKEKYTKPIQATLYIPKPVAANPPLVVSPPEEHLDAPKPNTPNQVKLKHAEPIETERRLIDSNPAMLDIDDISTVTNEQSTSVPAPTQGVNAVPNAATIQSATRRALSNLQSKQMQQAYEAYQAEYDSRDSRIIENAPRQPIEGTFSENLPPVVEQDCTERTKKILTEVSDLLGGRMRCRKVSNEQLNQFIDKHRQKTNLRPQAIGEKDQPN